MTKYGLRARVLAFTILPTLIIGCLLAGYFSFHRHQQLEEYIIDQGINVIEPLAIASEYGMKQNSHEMLRRLLSLSHRKNATLIKSIAVFTRDNQLFVTSNFHRELQRLRLPDGADLPDLTSVEFQGDDIILRTPIVEDVTLMPDMQDSNESRTIGYIAIQMSTDRALLMQYRDTALAILVVLACIALSFYFGLNLVNVVIDPINRMVRAVHLIRDGRLDTRVRGLMQGELDTLKNGINAMAKSLAEYHNEMQMNIDQATADLRETLEQIEIQNVELDLAKKRAQEAARVKSEFLANMSHELRTPLNGVIGFAKQLQKTPLSANQGDYLTTIEKSAKNLLNIINDILDFSKLEAGKLSLEQIPFSLRDVVNETMTLLAPSAHDKDLELSVRIEADVPDMLGGDPLRLQQILTNLTGNAIKFTEKGNVDVQISQLPPEDEQTVSLSIQIRDTGIGMSQQQLRQLFQPFNQADTSISRRYGGTGLGLVITQKLVQQMDGSIEVESHLEKGSLFTLILQMQRTGINNETARNPAVLHGQTILLIEPDPWSRAAYEAQLLEWQMQASVLASVTEVHQLPDMAFRFLLFGLERHPDLAHLPSQLAPLAGRYQDLLFLVNSHDPQLQEQLLALGAQHCLSKPVPHSKLLAALTQHTPSEPRLDVSPQKPHYLPLNVLAVDDNPANLKLITALLGDLVAEVHSCQNGRQAVELAQRIEFDLIFMDIQMPILDGISATQAIRQEGCNQQTPIIAVTAHAIPSERERLLEQGMDEYLSKPIDENQLERLLYLFAPHLGETSLPLLPAGEALSQPPCKGFYHPELALRQAAGKVELAQEMLNSLLTDLPVVKTLLEPLTADGAALMAAIHRLAGGAAYCGLPAVQQLCRRLEQALREGQTPDALEPELLELGDQIARIEQQAASWQQRLVDIAQN